MTKTKPTTTNQLPLPRLVPSGDLGALKDSLVIAAGGFEDRVFGLPEALGGRSRTGLRGLVLRYTPGEDGNRTEELIHSLRSKGLNINVRRDVLEFNRFHPANFAEALEDRLQRVEPSLVLLDISAMSKMAMLLALEVCRSLDLAVWLFYTEAREYHPSQAVYLAAREAQQIHQPSIQIYSGVGDVVRASRLSSVSMQGEPSAAVAFMSFNEALAQALLASIYPSRFFLINGRPPVHEWREEATAWIHEKLRSEWPEEDNPIDKTDSRHLPLRSTSTLHYQETVVTLLDLYWRLSTNYRIVVAPSGSKMQTVALFLVRALHRDIHVEYPTPKGYLRLFSKGIGSHWLLRFGKLGTLVAGLQPVEREQRLGIRGPKTSTVGSALPGPI